MIWRPLDVIPSITLRRNGRGQPETGEKRMSDYSFELPNPDDMPIHPRTGLRAIGLGKRGPIWPIMGGSGEGEGNPGGTTGDNPGGGESAPETETQNNGDGDPPKPTETVDFWKQKAREQESRAKANASAAKQLSEAREKLAEAEAEAAAVPAKIAEGLKAHLVARHEIDAEDAELFLTATDPELLLKQVDRLLAQSQSGKRRKNTNYVPSQGNADHNADKDSGIREFTRQLFGTNT
ncbi:scaffolding protein [Mycobacterium phage IdentityCrisis]|uniref:Scaffolding protein n=1 Tax=Mycobacterium phage IdentityCrisis TaxID=2599866 RepID=A0A5J6TH17_9CAUD|nr:scaffolding protein [Mycobacterium phage IdentityCrisis]QFG10026.1 scaffolding protein [Mycobacterium phage IdentityCrisis]